LTSPETPAYFARDGFHYVPQSISRGGWGPSLSGHAVGGLLGWALESIVDDADLQPARLTVDLLRPTALEPIGIQTQVVREGRRLRLVEATLTQRGTLTARASALFLRRCEQPPGQVWSEPVTMPPLPSESEVAEAVFFIGAYGWGAPVQRPQPGSMSGAGRKYAWLLLDQPVVEGEPLTAFTRAAMAGDITASLANWGTQDLQFINADYTITLSRLPVGSVLGLASGAHHSHEGVASGSATMVDRQGPVGSCVSTALAHNGFRPPSP
jgi:hypothetical protein